MKLKTEIDFAEYTNKIFNRLTIVKVYRVKNDIKADCVCICGNTKTAILRDIKNNKTKSCGCLRDLPATKRILRKHELPFGESSFRALYLSYKRSAKIRNLEFNISIEEFRHLTSNKCYYCNSEPSSIRKKVQGHGHYVYNGVDRVNNLIGYTLSNCVTCCKFCNRAKDTLSQQEFLNKIESIYKTRFTAAFV